MADHQHLSDDGSADKGRADRHRGFESFQSQLDAFVEREKAALAGAGEDAEVLQQRLDRFINSLQEKLDQFVQSQPIAADGSAPEPVVAENPETAEQAPRSAADALVVCLEPIDDTVPGDEYAASEPAVRTKAAYPRLIFGVLLGASCITAAILWFVWPVGQVSSPRLLPELSSPTVVPTVVPGDEPIDGPAVAAHPLAEAGHPSRPSDTANLKKTAETAPVAQASSARAQSTAPERQPVRQPVAVPKIKQAANTPAAVKQAAVPAVSEPTRLTVSVRIGNIRSAPKRSARVLYRLAAGAVVTRLAVQGDWYQVRLRNGTVAWAHRSIF